VQDIIVNSDFLYLVFLAIKLLQRANGHRDTISFIESSTCIGISTSKKNVILESARFHISFGGRPPADGKYSRPIFWLLHPHCYEYAAGMRKVARLIISATAECCR
jgi:hypothetical protein